MSHTQTLIELFFMLKNLGKSICNRSDWIRLNQGIIIELFRTDRQRSHKHQQLIGLPADILYLFKLLFSEKSVFAYKLCFFGITQKFTDKCLHEFLISVSVGCAKTSMR